ncbi:hypothetical protein Vretimale_16190 [Volvox reticuliferus]|uniref:Uncharacterized protein n=3 Tax=Volvox reticuliferus TaxID=1737510 RepID=A0A8J4GSC9_9CHLO|nr:hypothetical protein Vretimale_16190 [Volvox reticuliferus]
MLLAPAPITRRQPASTGTGACSSRFLSTQILTRTSRRPCKPVCFRENAPDRIEDATTGRSSNAVPSGAATPPRSYGMEPMVSTAGLRTVNLGPVASVMYPILTYATFVSAAAAILAPNAVGMFVFRNTALTTVHKMMIMCAGAAIIPSIFAKRQIKRAADSGILASPTYKQMVSACLLNGVLGLVVLSQAVSLRNPLLAASVGGITALATLTASYTLMKIRESGQLAPSASGMLGGLMSLLTPTNVTAAAYSIATVALAVVGVMMFTADPSTPSMLFIMPKDPVQVFCSRIIGGATLANSVLLFTVKQAADDGRQGSPTFRNINAGIASYAAITAGVLGYGLATGWAKSVPPFWGLCGVMVTTALLSGFNWVTAPK